MEKKEGEQGKYHLFGQLLRKYLDKRGVSETDLAKAIGRNRTTVNKWANGIHQVPYQLLLKIVDDILQLQEPERGELLSRAGYHTDRSEYQRRKGKETPDKPVEVITVDHDLSYAEVYVNRGIAHYRQGRLIEAIADYNRAIVIDINYAKAYVDRGIAYYTQGKLDDALSDYNRAIALDSNYAEAYVNRGIAYYRQGKLIEAIADYDKAITIDLNYAKAYLDRGIAYYHQGKVTEAIADYNKAIALNPSYSDQLVGITQPFY